MILPDAGESFSVFYNFSQKFTSTTLPSAQRYTRSRYYKILCCIVFTVHLPCIPYKDSRIYNTSFINILKPLWMTSRD